MSGLTFPHIYNLSPSQILKEFLQFWLNFDQRVPAAEAKQKY